MLAERLSHGSTNRGHGPMRLPTDCHGPMRVPTDWHGPMGVSQTATVPRVSHRLPRSHGCLTDCHGPTGVLTDCPTSHGCSQNATVHGVSQDLPSVPMGVPYGRQPKTVKQGLPHGFLSKPQKSPKRIMDPRLVPKGP
eukprot:jgi/Botrbrau1/15678/Bobra.4_1s0057.1